MNKNDPKFRRFANLQGHLQKLSSNFLLGYQPKFWKVIDNGTKVGYSNQPNQPIRAENLFLIKECFASQASGNTIFQLQTRDRVFSLKAPNEEERTDWIKGLTFLKKMQTSQAKVKNQISPTETTIASRSQKLKPKKSQNPPQSSPPAPLPQKPRTHQPEDLIQGKNIQSDLIQQLIKYLPQKCLKYYTLITNLKVKSQGIFMDSFNSNTYLLISTKSLYPDIYIGEDNLTNISLPPWLEVNYFYKIASMSSKEKDKKKEIFHISKLIDMQEGSDRCSIKINTGQIIYQFFTETVGQKECLQSCLEIAAANAQEVVINGKITKKNYDKIIDLNETKLPQFQNEIKKIIQSFLDDPNVSKYQPSNLVSFMDRSLGFLKDFMMILSGKKKNKDHVVLDTLKLFHEEVKMQAKLTWDSSFMTIKGTDILNILRKLSEYYDLMKNFIKSAQFLQGMKELSKIYVRQSWKNFQSIIFSIVQQQKSSNIFQDEYCQYLQTHGITDLFKFIYSVFDLAYPHWKNKIHLHNVNRLMQRALQVFVNEIRAMIDEEVIEQRQMIGLANNYFAFSDYVKEFYTEKFQELAEKTHEAYDKITASFREVSMIILEKLAAGVGMAVETYFDKCTIQTIKAENLEDILVKSMSSYQKLLHMAFVKKIYQKIAKQVHLKLCMLLSQQVKTKKKLKLKQIIRCVKELRSNLNLIFDGLCKSHTIIDKKMEQLQMILSFDLYSDIEAIMFANTEPLKGIYMKILELREDYYEGSALMRIINEHSSHPQQNPQIKRSLTKRRGSIDIRQKNATLSKQYFQQEIMDSDENSVGGDEKSVSQNKGKSKQGTAVVTVVETSKLISEGYLTKGKRNQKVWEKQYFRLKNGYLYIFQTADSQRCRNAIQIRNILKIDVLNKQKPSFLLTYKTLNKQKQIKLKAQTIELRERWVHSIQLEKKRMLNEEQVKKKAIKYRETQNNVGRKKFMMIIDYEELEKGKDYFSYSG